MGEGVPILRLDLHELQIDPIRELRASCWQLDDAEAAISLFTFSVLAG